MKDYQLTSDGLYAYRWPLNALPELAFDHDKILADAKRLLGING